MRFENAWRCEGHFRLSSPVRLQVSFQNRFILAGRVRIPSLVYFFAQSLCVMPCDCF
jgi:hypothetical protein